MMIYTMECKYATLIYREKDGETIPEYRCNNSSSPYHICDNFKMCVCIYRKSPYANSNGSKENKKHKYF